MLVLLFACEAAGASRARHFLRPLISLGENSSKTRAHSRRDIANLCLKYRHCEEPTGPAFGRSDDKLRDEAIQTCDCGTMLDCFAEPVIGRSPDPLARKDGVDGPRRHQCARLVMSIRPDEGAVHERD